MTTGNTGCGAPTRTAPAVTVWSADCDASAPSGDFGDHAGIYLRRSISKISRNENSIIRFNDSRSGYAEIRAAILLARKLAREVADRQVA